MSNEVKLLLFGLFLLVFGIYMFINYFRGGGLNWGYQWLPFIGGVWRKQKANPFDRLNLLVVASFFLIAGTLTIIVNLLKLMK